MGEHLDGCLDADRTREMNAHLADCNACRRELEELRQTVALLRGMPAAVPPSDLLASVHRRLARQQESPLILFWRVLSLPQTRMVAAAALIVVVGAYGWRTLESPSHDALGRDGVSRRSLSAEAEGRPSMVEERLSQSSGGAGSVPTEREGAMHGVQALTAVATGRSPEGEAKGKIWGGANVGEARKNKAQTVGGLSVGDGSELAAAPGTRESEPLAAGKARAAAAAPTMATKTFAARALVARPVTKPAEDASVDRLAATKADTYARVAPTPEAAPARQDDREILLAASDAAAVRKILAQYAVRGDDKHADGASVPVKEVESRRDRSAGSGTLITGWVPAARYAQLLASLQSVGSVESLPEKRPRAEDQAIDLLFVRIRLVPPAK